MPFDLGTVAQEGRHSPLSIPIIPIIPGCEPGERQRLLSVVTHATLIIARCDVTGRAKLEAPTTSTEAQSDTNVIHRTGRSHGLRSPDAPGCITSPCNGHFSIGNNTLRADASSLQGGAQQLIRCALKYAVVSTGGASTGAMAAQSRLQGVSSHNKAQVTGDPRDPEHCLVRSQIIEVPGQAESFI
eukprot:582004-Prorocentrum_minimum.AAC.1